MRNDMEDFFQIGIVTSPHGIRGEVKVYPTTDDPGRFKRLRQVLVGDERRPLELEGVKFFKNMVIAKLGGIDTPEAAAGLRQKSLYVARKDAVDLGRDEYFIADLMGLRVLDEQERELGILEDVLQTGANDVYQIRLAEGGELLLPAIRECILFVDVKQGFMKVHVLEGLLEK